MYASSSALAEQAPSQVLRHDQAHQVHEPLNSSTSALPPGRAAAGRLGHVQYVPGGCVGRALLSGDVCHHLGTLLDV